MRFAERQDKVMCGSLKFHAKAVTVSQCLQNCIAITRVAEIIQSRRRLVARGTENLSFIGTAACLRHRYLVLFPRTRQNILCALSQLQRKPPSLRHISTWFPTCMSRVEAYGAVQVRSNYCYIDAAATHDACAYHSTVIRCLVPVRTKG